MRTDELNLKIKRLLGEPAKRALIRLLFPWRNDFMLFNWSERALDNRVNLDYWHESPNLGDAISPVVVNHMLSQRGIAPDVKVQGKRHLYAVGSVLTAGIQDATVWGSGVLNAALTYRLSRRKLDVRAVRGPITRAVLMDYGFNVPEVYGDPAILMPEIYQPTTVGKCAKYGLVLHKDYDASKAFSDAELGGDVLSLDIRTDDYASFLGGLTSVERVISSSLHGVILAEAYGVPAVLLKPQTDIIKYYDYYYSTGRFDFPMATSLEEARRIQPPELPELSGLREGLKRAFPWDLYR